MHVKRFLHNLLSPVIHLGRLNTLSETVESAIRTKTLSLTALGRGIETGIQERSGIQKVNRLLKNKHLQKEQKAIAKAVANLLIGHKKKPIILVDWTKYPQSESAVLRASLATPGRALTIYEECHAFKKMGNGKVQQKFLASLKAILPNDCQAIMVTDAGFHNDWFKEVLKLGFDYGGRIRGLKQYRVVGENTFYACNGLFKKAQEQVQCLGKVVLTKKNPLETYFYLVKKKLKGRKAFTRKGKIKRDKDSKNYGRSQREPWLLASSLQGRNAAKKVKGIYEKRMTIEEAFRDLKSARYGLGLDEGKTRRKDRRIILLLIALLATLMAYLIGRVGEHLKLHYQFQSNSIKHRRVLSLFYLGCQLIRKKIAIPISSIREAIISLKNEVQYG